ncbi:MAG: PH domain-containing protein [Candidatus Saccharibacteria bacterium]|nr:PH domain-containing protein [Candidatus Saccharibacteria bacterium]
MNTPNPHDNTPQPVAYDAQGRPLYLHPPATPSEAPPISPEPSMRSSHVTARPEVADGHNFDPRIRTQYANEPQVVHTTRPLDPQPFQVSDEVRQKHEASVRRYPFLNLSEAEYVILDIKRHPIGIVIPMMITAVLAIAILAFAALYPSLITTMTVTMMPSPEMIFGIALLFVLLTVMGGAVALWVYLQNQFFMTNESVIQEIQHSLFSRHEQTVSLGSIEDASFRQDGIVQMLFNYGTIRLSTEGEETTYVFHYVANPKRQIAILNNAIEAFKNGRPVDD